MPQPEITEILEKYEKQEENVNQLLTQLQIKKQQFSFTDYKRSDLPSKEEAKERNKKLLQDLETIKGNLRSKAIFSPTEMQWEKICKTYQQKPALVPTKYKCNLAVFV